MLFVKNDFTTSPSGRNTLTVGTTGYENAVLSLVDQIKEQCIAAFSDPTSLQNGLASMAESIQNYESLVSGFVATVDQHNSDTLSVANQWRTNTNIWIDQISQFLDITNSNITSVHSLRTATLGFINVNSLVYPIVVQIFDAFLDNLTDNRELLTRLAAQYNADVVELPIPTLEQYDASTDETSELLRDLAVAVQSDWRLLAEQYTNKVNGDVAEFKREFAEMKADQFPNSTMSGSTEEIKLKVEGLISETTVLVNDLSTKFLDTGISDYGADYQSMVTDLFAGLNGDVSDSLDATSLTGTELDLAVDLTNSAANGSAANLHQLFKGANLSTQLFDKLIIASIKASFEDQIGYESSLDEADDVLDLLETNVQEIDAAVDIENAEYAAIGTTLIGMTGSSAAETAVLVRSGQILADSQPINQYVEAVDVWDSIIDNESDVGTDDRQVFKTTIDFADMDVESSSEIIKFGNTSTSFNQLSIESSFNNEYDDLDGVVSGSDLDDFEDMINSQHPMLTTISATIISVADAVNDYEIARNERIEAASVPNPTENTEYVDASDAEDEAIAELATSTKTLLTQFKNQQNDLKTHLAGFSTNLSNNLSRGFLDSVAEKVNRPVAEITQVIGNGLLKTMAGYLGKPIPTFSMIENPTVVRGWATADADVSVTIGERITAARQYITSLGAVNTTNAAGIQSEFNASAGAFVDVQDGTQWIGETVQNRGVIPVHTGLRHAIQQRPGISVIRSSNTRRYGGQTISVFDELLEVIDEIQSIISQIGRTLSQVMGLLGDFSRFVRTETNHIPITNNILSASSLMIVPDLYDPMLLPEFANSGTLMPDSFAAQNDLIDFNDQISDSFDVDQAIEDQISGVDGEVGNSVDSFQEQFGQMNEDLIASVEETPPTVVMPRPTPPNPQTARPPLGQSFSSNLPNLPPAYMNRIPWQMYSKKRFLKLSQRPIIDFYPNPNTYNASFPFRAQESNIQGGKSFSFWRNPISGDYFDAWRFTFTVQSGNLMPGNVADPATTLPYGTRVHYDIHDLLNEERILEDGQTNFGYLHISTYLYPDLLMEGMWAPDEFSFSETAENPFNLEYSLTLIVLRTVPDIFNFNEMTAQYLRAMNSQGAKSNQTVSPSQSAVTVFDEPALSDDQERSQYTAATNARTRNILGV